MTYQEAIEFAKEGLNHSHDIYTGYQEPREFLEVSIEALEKQIARIPINDVRYTSEKCPICSDFLHDVYSINKRPNFCRNCGQHIDWSDAE